MKVDTIIIGGGISGLSAGHFLSKKKKDFLILEARNRAGGVIQTEIHKNLICENGPNTILLNNASIEQIIKDCGLWGDLIFPSENSEKNRFVFNNNKLTKIPLSLKEIIYTPIFSIYAKLRLCFEIFIKKHKKDTTVFKFINNRFGKEFHDKLIEPVLSGIYAGNTKEMSSKHSLKFLWDLEQSYGSIIKGLIKIKKNKNKSKAFNFPLGLSQLIKAMENSFNSKIKLNSCVSKIIKKDNGYELTVNGNKIIYCNNIISTVPAYVLEKLIYDLNIKNVLKKIKYCPLDVFHIGLKKDKIKNKVRGFGVLTKPDDKKKYLGVLLNSQIFSHVSSKDDELLTIMVGGENQKDLCLMESSRLEKIIINEIKSLLNYEGDPFFKKKYRWEKAIPQYNLNQEELVEKVKEFQKNNPNFYITGNYFNGISVSDCIYKADKLVKKFF